MEAHVRCAGKGARGSVVVGVQVLQGLHEAAGHVAGVGGLHRSVHQPLPPRHGVEEELRGPQPAAGRQSPVSPPRQSL